MILLASALMEPVAKSPICVRRKPVAILLASALVGPAVILLASVLMEPVVAALRQGSAVLDVPGVLQLVPDCAGILRLVTPVPRLVLDRVGVQEVHEHFWTRVLEVHEVREHFWTRVLLRLLLDLVVHRFGRPMKV